MRPTSLESKTLQPWLLLALSCGSSLTERRGDSELARRPGMVRSDNSCHFLFLGHILSPLESVGNCCCLCIHLHWLALPDKRRQLSLVEGKTFVSTTSLIIWASLDSTSSSNSPYICAERDPSFFLWPVRASATGSWQPALLDREMKVCLERWGGVVVLSQWEADPHRDQRSPCCAWKPNQRLKLLQDWRLAAPIPWYRLVQVQHLIEGRAFLRIG